MYAHIQRQFSEKVADINELLLEMSVDARLMPAAVVSSASTPSLRSREGSIAPAFKDGGGNVRVVVRVRGFLQRGEYSSW
jgi:hypothetical protein